ncbi:hypothetical protein CK203_098137 [Vitis vinifera]|uniref:Uncharacterized protein n=1 Tax=Vitis vinifera TaxID=29760 RepID=A0A438C665_VITVI|nr:hypothetical protein CK203_098137 [Vitis vinifera]
MDFYQSMTTQGAQSPTTIHFNIDRCQGILEARCIAEALHIPYEPVDQHIFRSGPLYLSGTWSASYPGGLLKIHSFYRRGAILDALFRISKGFYFGPHHLIMAALLHFEEKDELPTESVPPVPTAPPILRPSLLRLLPLTPFFTNCTVYIGGLIHHFSIEFRAMPIASTEETIRADVPSQATHEAAIEPSSPPESPAP